MDELVKSMESLHKRVSDLRTKRQEYTDKINLKNGATAPRFEEGDYVL